MTENRFVMDTNAVIFLTTLSDRINIMAITDAVKEKTIEIRRATKIKLPDSIIAATAIVLDAVLITNDPHLLNLSLPGYTVKTFPLSPP